MLLTCNVCVIFPRRTNREAVAPAAREPRCPLCLHSSLHASQHRPMYTLCEFILKSEGEGEGTFGMRLFFFIFNKWVTGLGVRTRTRGHSCRYPNSTPALLLWNKKTCSQLVIIKPTSAWRSASSPLQSSRPPPPPQPLFFHAVCCTQLPAQLKKTHLVTMVMSSTAPEVTDPCRQLRYLVLIGFVLTCLNFKMSQTC